MSVHATISSTFERIYWSRFLQAQLRYIFDILFLLFSASHTNYHFQFENVGSPTTCKAMEEKVDVERTETGVASHTQRTETVHRESSSGTTLGDISLLDHSMYYWAPAVQAPVEQHISFNASPPPIFSPHDASHVSISAILSAQIEYLILILVEFTIQVPWTQAEYLYGLASSHRLFTMQVIDSWRVSIFTIKYANICVICMKCIILTMKMQQSYADDLKCQNERLR